MVKIPHTCAPVNAHGVFAKALDDALISLCHTMSARLNALLVAIVSYVVGRDHHVRRQEVPRAWMRGGKCCRCGSTQSHHFSRNGFRLRRRLLFPWGELEFDLPRVRCECGGSVQIDFGDLIHPYQRIAGDVDAQIQRWAALGMSLRRMSLLLGQMRIGPLALRTLMERLHGLEHLDPHCKADDVPPVLEVDAVWVTLLRPNGRVRRDRKGRKRPVKGRFRVPILIAMGVWPDSGRREILAWELGESESTEEWVRFLEALEAQGIRGENGLKLIIHDGGSGLCSALQVVWFGAPQQRCLFHKLRNIYNSIRVPEGLSAIQGQRYRRKVLKDFQAIWEPRRYETALHRYLQVVRRYRETQPEAVATLRRDFRLTVTYYALEQQFPTWERRYLRTISHLERFNRRLRARARVANAYHSETGLKAMVAQEVYAFHAASSST